MKFKTTFWVLTSVLVVALNACDSSSIYNESSPLEGAVWDELDTLRASFNATDSIHYHNIYLLARFNSLYPYSNIYFKVLLQGPNGMATTEIKSFDITDKSGKWLGSGFGDLHSYELPLFSDIAIKQFGKYTVKVIPYMRKDKIEGIHDRGIKVNIGKEIF